jgi:hypothetical protein
MIWLGVRCWKDKVALVAVADSPDGPKVVLQRRQPAPRGGDAGSRAAWFARIATEAIEESGSGGVSVRIADSNPDQARVEAEGAVLAAAGQAGLPTRTFRRQSLMKPLGVGRGTGDWKRFQQEDGFVGGMVGDEKDAAMAALGAART